MVDLVKNMHAEEMQRRGQFDSRTSAPNQHFILNILFRSLGDKLDLFVVGFLFISRVKIDCFPIDVFIFEKFFLYFL
jgi:hypothetical protein